MEKMSKENKKKFRTIIEFLDRRMYYVLFLFIINRMYNISFLYQDINFMFKKYNLFFYKNKDEL